MRNIIRHFIYQKENCRRHIWLGIVLHCYSPKGPLHKGFSLLIPNFNSSYPCTKPISIAHQTFLSPIENVCIFMGLRTTPPPGHVPPRQIPPRTYTPWTYTPWTDNPEQLNLTTTLDAERKKRSFTLLLLIFFKSFIFHFSTLTIS